MIRARIKDPTDLIIIFQVRLIIHENINQIVSKS